MISAPIVLVIDIPFDHRGPGPALGRYYTAIVETDEEFLELEKFLSAPRETLVHPATFEYRLSALRSDHVLLSRYEPPEPGWPCSPLPVAESLRSCPRRARGGEGSYIMVSVDTPQALDAHNVTILGALGARHGISI